MLSLSAASRTCCAVVPRRAIYICSPMRITEDRRSRGSISAMNKEVRVDKVARFEGLLLYCATLQTGSQTRRSLKLLVRTTFHFSDSCHFQVQSMRIRGRPCKNSSKRSPQSPPVRSGRIDSQDRCACMHTGSSSPARPDLPDHPYSPGTDPASRTSPSPSHNTGSPHNPIPSHSPDNTSQTSPYPPQSPTAALRRTGNTSPPTPRRSEYAADPPRQISRPPKYTRSLFVHRNDSDGA